MLWLEQARNENRNKPWIPLCSYPELLWRHSRWDGETRGGTRGGGGRRGEQEDGKAFRGLTSLLQVESAFEFARICRKHDYHNFLFSMKVTKDV